MKTLISLIQDLKYLPDDRHYKAFSKWLDDHVHKVETFFTMNAGEYDRLCGNREFLDYISQSLINEASDRLLELASLKKPHSVHGAVTCQLNLFVISEAPSENT
jgi:hypothetical protein